MTIDRIILKELVEKGSDADLLREMIAVIADRMMDMDVENLTGAAHGERSPERTKSSARVVTLRRKGATLRLVGQLNARYGQAVLTSTD
jgi:hypothetical protein